ncbi:MAG: hypothetical protein AAF367_02335 [Pseudomonadota bacterium]
MIRGLVIVSCLALTAGFVAITALPWLQTPDERPGLSAADRAATAAPVLHLRAPMPTDMTSITERPLFSAVRRPPPPEEPGTPLIDPNADLLFGEYEISGVVMLGDSAMAMLRDREGRLTRVRTGDQVETPDGIAVVTAITLNALTFRRGGDTVTATVQREGVTTE